MVRYNVRKKLFPRLKGIFFPGKYHFYFPQKLLKSIRNELFTLFANIIRITQFSLFLADPTGDCGGVLIERTGEIHSMDIDGYYPADAYCQWLIVGERDAVIELTFLTFELEADSACKYDAVLVS